MLAILFFVFFSSNTKLPKTELGKTGLTMQSPQVHVYLLGINIKSHNILFKRFKRRGISWEIIQVRLSNLSQIKIDGKGPSLPLTRSHLWNDFYRRIKYHCRVC